MSIDTQLQLLRTWRDTVAADAPRQTSPGLRQQVSSQAAQALDCALRSRRGARAERAGGGLFNSNEVAPV